MSEFFRIALAIVAILSCAIGFAISWAANYDSVNVESLISECEAPLPRDQHCKIIAIPEVTK